MSKIKVGINGMGRIGRTVLRELFKRTNADIEVVGVNNPGNPKDYVHLLKYDSVHGKYEGEVKVEDGNLFFGGSTIKFFTERDPAQIPWSDLGVQVVIDATGVFRDGPSLSKHISGTVKKVILCAPGKELDGTFVMGINNDTYDNDKHHVISNASCTTNCLAPVVKVLNDKWGVKKGFMTTVHSYTSDQSLLDGSHSDPRRARAAALSMIPTTTGAAKAVGLVIPELKGKLDGYAIRVPTPNVSLVDINVELNAQVSAEEVNAAIKEATTSNLKGVLDYTDEPLVSCDYMTNPYSSTVDGALTNVIDGMVKVVTWYDNEAGFSNRVIDLAGFIGAKL